MNGLETERFNLMDAEKKSFYLFIFPDEVIEYLFSNIWGGIERESDRLKVPPSWSIESEQSVLTMRNYESF